MVNVFYLLAVFVTQRVSSLAPGSGKPCLKELAAVSIAHPLTDNLVYEHPHQHDEVVKPVKTLQHPLVKTVLQDVGYEPVEMIPLPLANSTKEYAVLAKGSFMDWVKLMKSFENAESAIKYLEVERSESHSILIYFAHSPDILNHEELLEQLVANRNALAHKGAYVLAGLVFANIIDDRYNKKVGYYYQAIDDAKAEAEAAAVLENGLFVLHQSYNLMNEKIDNYLAELRGAERARAKADLHELKHERASHYTMVQNAMLHAKTAEQKAAFEKEKQAWIIEREKEKQARIIEQEKLLQEIAELKVDGDRL